MGIKKLDLVVVVSHRIQRGYLSRGVKAEIYLMPLALFKDDYDAKPDWFIVAHAGYSLIQKSVFVLEIKQNGEKIPYARPALVAKVKSWI
jgi:hypothetical protein